MNSDTSLLRQYAKQRDAEAFAVLVRRHTPLVYSTSLRVTANAHEAEDVTQECFLELARQAGGIKVSLPGWLHRVATRRAIDAVRRSVTRQRYEDQAMAENHCGGAPSWQQIAPRVDEALEDFPDELREPLVLHYLQGLSQSEIADKLGVHQATVSRRLEKGTAELRDRLTKAGVVVAVAVLAGLLTQNASAAAVPPTLTVALGKLALAGVGKSGAAGGAASTFLGALGGKLVTAAVAGITAAVAITTIVVTNKHQETNMTTNVRRDGNKIWIEGVPHGGPGNSYARGLEILLKHTGTPVDYDTIMGDTGQAFILQSEEGGPIIEEAVDVGWWPLASWGVKMRVDFLGRTVGRKLHCVAGDENSYRKDPAAHYRERFESAVQTSIAAGKPLLADQNLCFVVTGYDDGKPPLLGNCAWSDKEMMNRIEEYPWGLIILDDKRARLDRREADLAALRHAVALAQDTPQVTVPTYFKEWQGVRGRFTGQKSFALWAAALRDMEHLGQARWHSNMVLHLGINRRSAVAYLRTMAKRHSKEVAAHLNAAADLYDRLLVELKKADPSEPALKSKTGRETLAKLVESMAGLDQQAIAEIEKALAKP